MSQQSWDQSTSAGSLKPPISENNFSEFSMSDLPSIRGLVLQCPTDAVSEPEHIRMTEQLRLKVFITISSVSDTLILTL